MQRLSCRSDSNEEAPMIEPPQLFDANGKMIPNIDTSKMDAPMLELYSAVANAYMANQQSEKINADALAEVKASLAALNNVEEYIRAHWRPQQFHDLWKQSFSGDD